jgi:hypothetical protein
MGNPLIPLNSFQNGLLGGGGEGMHGLGVLYFAYHMFSLACFVPTSANGVALASLSRRTLDVGAAVTWQAALRFSSAYCALPLLVLLAWAAAHDWLLPFAPEFMLGKVPVATFFLMAAVLSTLQVPAHLYLIAHHRLGRHGALGRDADHRRCLVPDGRRGARGGICCLLRQLCRARGRASSGQPLGCGRRPVRKPDRRHELTELRLVMEQA